MIKYIKNIQIPNGEEYIIDGTSGKITNCVIEQNENIKYTLVDGVLTLKSGSIFTIPYGIEDKSTEFPVGSTFINENFKVYETEYVNQQTDQPRFWVRVQMQEDLICSDFNVSVLNADCVITVNINSNSVSYNGVSAIFSGEDNSSATNQVYYDIKDNIIYFRNSTTGEWIEEVKTLPVMIGHRNAGKLEYITNVFQHVGYIGTSIFCIKGIKGLFPDERNENNTLKNYVYTIPQTRIYNSSATNTVYNLTLTTNHINQNVLYNIVWDNVASFNEKEPPNGFWYNPTLNIAQYKRDWDGTGLKWQRNYAFNLGTVIITNSIITQFPNIGVFPVELAKLKDLEQLGTFKVGQPQISLDNILGVNEIWLEGAEVSRTTYSELFAIYGTTYGAGDGSTTFKLPDFRNRAIWGSNGFGYINAGLPNITGSINPSWEANIGRSANGAFYVGTTGGNNEVPGNPGGGNTTWYFEAKRSNAIYGASNTVQPPAIKVRVKTRYR